MFHFKSTFLGYCYNRVYTLISDFTLNIIDYYIENECQDTGLASLN